MSWILYSTFLLLPFFAFAQIGTETAAYDQVVLELLHKKVLKDKTLGGDCQCSPHLHANYPLVVLDSMYKVPLLDDLFAFSLSNLTNNPFPQYNFIDLQWHLMQEEITRICPRSNRLPSSKKINPKKTPKRYYQVARYTPIQIEDKIFAFFELQEVRPDRSCTLIIIILVIHQQGDFLEAIRETICD